MVEEGLGGREGVEDDGGGVRGGNKDVVMVIGIDEGGVEGAEGGEEEGRVERTSSPRETAATFLRIQEVAVVLEEAMARSWLLGTLMVTWMWVPDRARRMSGLGS